MEDLEKGLDEKGLIDFVKTVLLSGTNPRSNEAVENLKWGFKQYRKQLLLDSVGNQRELLIAYCKHILDECTDDDKETIDEFLELNSN